MLRPAQGLQLGVNGAYTDARIRSGAVPLGGKDGDRISFIPRFSGSATADYRTTLAGRELHFNLGYRYVGSRFAMLESNPAARRARPYGLVDAGAALSDDRWTLRLFAKNLFDKRAFLSPVPLRRGATTVYYVSPVVEPRVIGISLDTRF
jgi:outer membrane receptor protein involved in Fe transport